MSQSLSQTLSERRAASQPEASVNSDVSISEYVNMRVDTNHLEGIKESPPFLCHSESRFKKKFRIILKVSFELDFLMSVGR